MTSTPTTRNRFMKQADGDNTNTWGDVMNAQVFDMIDASLDGWAYLTPTGPQTLTTGLGVADQARMRGLKFLAGSAAVTTSLPAVEKLYLVWNASAADQTFASQGGGATCVIRAGEVVWICTDAVNVARATVLSMENSRLQNVVAAVGANDAVNFSQMNAAISAAAFSSGAFGVPIVPGNNGQFLTNNGSTPNWATLSVTNLSDYVADQATRQAATLAKAAATAIAFAAAL